MAQAQETDLNAITGTNSQSGSLWSDGRARMLVGMEGNARMVGDLINIVISEQTATRVMAGTQSARESTVSNSIGTVFGLETNLLNMYPDLGGEIKLSADSASDFRGDGTTSREGTLTGRLTVKVVEVKENGNLMVFGWKEVRSNRETQYLSLSGMVRPQDIRVDNTVVSHLIAEARIEYTGAGVVADKQGPGFGTRIVDHVWPF